MIVAIILKALGTIVVTYAFHLLRVISITLQSARLGLITASMAPTPKVNLLLFSAAKVRELRQLDIGISIFVFVGFTLIVTAIWWPYG